MSRLIYCATPSRLVHKINEIMDFVTNEGNAPLHPFQAFPYERFEGNPNVGRKESMEYCLRLVNISDKVYLFGVSEGTLDEISHALEIKKPITLHLDFDSEWNKFYKKLRLIYNNPLVEFLK